MNRISILVLATFALGSVAQAMSVKEGDIAGKTNLILVANTTVSGKAEAIVADAAGFSLYTFEMDSAGVSKCSGSCLTEWPPEHVPAGSTVAAPFGTIKGNDGQNQLTLNGLPLYHFSSDKSPGSTLGEYPGWDVVQVVN